MGSRRLPRKEALAALLILWAAGLAAACESDGASVTATPTQTAPGTTAVAATASPTPDLVGRAPASVEDAAGRLGTFMATWIAPCAGAASLERAWGAVCASGDLDGDGRVDAAVLVPLPGNEARTPNPGVVFVSRAAGPGLERFPPGGEADASIVGRGILSIAERTGDARPDLVLLANSCGAHTCSSRVYIESWDGTAWRDFGPGVGIDSVEAISFGGTGINGQLVMRGGIINSVGAGPQRAATTTYTFDGVRWSARSILPDKAAYLFHAVRDADDLFDRAKFADAITAYTAAIDARDLKDWKLETNAADGRDSLKGYALLRIAVATAALGLDANRAMDAAIRDGKEPLFTNAAQAFRRGLQEGNGVHAGCLEVTQYLGTPGVPEIVRAMLDYGYGNHPVKTYREICPL